MLHDGRYGVWDWMGTRVEWGRRWWALTEKARSFELLSSAVCGAQTLGGIDSFSSLLVLAAPPSRPHRPSLRLSLLVLCVALIPSGCTTPAHFGSSCPPSESPAPDLGSRRAVFCLLRLPPSPRLRFWFLMHRWIPPRQPVPLQMALTPGFPDRPSPSPQSLSFSLSPSLPLSTSPISQASRGPVTL